jgi:hypothetical protein
MSWFDERNLSWFQKGVWKNIDNFATQIFLQGVRVSNIS